MGTTEDDVEGVSGVGIYYGHDKYNSWNRRRTGTRKMERNWGHPLERILRRMGSSQQSGYRDDGYRFEIQAKSSCDTSLRFSGVPSRTSPMPPLYPSSLLE